MSSKEALSTGNGVATTNDKPHSNGKSNGHYSNSKSPATGSITSNSSSSDLLRQEEVDPCPEQVGYSWSLLKSLILYPLAAFPLGAGLLLAYWFPHVWVRLTCWRCPLQSATYIIIKDLDGKHRVECVRTVELPPSSIQEEAPLVEESDIEETVLLMPQAQTVKFFEHRHLRYIYTEKLGKYVLLKNYDSDCLSIHDLSLGLTSAEHKEKLVYHGANSIDVPVKSYHVLFIEEVLHPFYIFQILATIFWIADEYYLYASVVFLISTLSVLISLVQTRRHRQQLHDMVVSSSTVTVMRDGKELDGVASEDLVPGDVLVIPPRGMSMPCDAALLSGHAIVNEAMLTGESVPVTKTPLPQDSAPYSPDRHKRHTLFCGTQVIQTRFYANTPVTAVIVRTGFSTSKGGMVRSILFPKPLNMKFYADAIKFILVLSLIAAGGFIYTVSILQAKHYQVKETILRALDVITIIVPPALPAALTVGTVYALNRLRKQKIYCISPQRVNLCGKVKLVCFDKTGTLTEDSLDLYGVRPASGGLFAPFVEDPCCLSPGPMVYGMATCHSLTTIDGELTGDPLDLKMFNGTKWVLEEPGEDSSRFDSVVPTVVKPPPSSSHLYQSEEPIELGILRQFTFSSELQRMSVLVRALPSKDPKLLHVYVKGAPETIKRLCIPETIPADFLEVLTTLTQQGYRVLAIGHKTMHLPWHRAERVQRNVVECDLMFAGLIVMQNRLKPETSPVIQTLLKANIRSVMVTGDNMLTAVSVARECGMIPTQSRAIVVKASFASTAKKPRLSYHAVGETSDQIHLLRSSSMSEPYRSDAEGLCPPSYQENLDPPLGGVYHLVVEGKSFEVIREHCPQVMERLLVKGTVFARMSPDQKAQLVTSLMDIGYGVAMCGDGANDCGALKAAHAGISLSETEASVASPFTSKEANITCVPNVIREGRAALVTSFSAFKYMALYSIAEFISAAILYTYESNLSDFMYIYIDLVLVLAFAFVMGFTGPYHRLVRRRPPGTLAGIHVLMSVIVQALLLVAFQLGALFYLKRQHWYQEDPLIPKANDTNIVAYETTTIFHISIYQYIGLVIAFSTAAPFRKSFLTNYWFVLCLIVLFPANLYITLAPSSWWWKWLLDYTQLKLSSDIYFKLGLVLLALNHCVLAYFLEGYIFPTEWMRKLLRFVRCKRRPTNRYKHIVASIPPQWPPIAPADSLN